MNLPNLSPSHILAVVLLVAVLAAGVWDVWAAAYGRPKDTVSEIIYQWSRDYPILPLLVGLLLGHLFWRMAANGSLPR